MKVYCPHVGVLWKRRLIVLYKEIFRKSIHLCSGFVPLCLKYFYKGAIGLLVFAGAFYTLTQVLSLNGRRVPLVSDITDMAARERDRGKFVLGPLTLVLGILLTVTFLLTTLLQMPGGLLRVTLRYAQMQQRIYDGESALIAYLEGFPEDFFKLPKVERSRRGPWVDLSVSAGEKCIHVLAGIACDSACGMLRSSKLRHEIYEGFRQQLNREITMVRPPLTLQIKSGNRRLLGLASAGSSANSQALWVQEGDLFLDLDDDGKHAPRAFSGRFIADGSIDVRGSVLIDTLRLYARGPLYLRGPLLRGALKIQWLEAFSETVTPFKLNDESRQAGGTKTNDSIDWTSATNAFTCWRSSARTRLKPSKYRPNTRTPAESTASATQTSIKVKPILILRNIT